MHPKHLVIALTLACSLGQTAWSAEPSQRPARPASPAMTTDAAANELLPRSVFQVLLGEIALQRGAIDLSAEAWADLAERTRDLRVIARATEVAGYAGQSERALALTRLWLEVDPDSIKARQNQAALLIQSSRLDQLAPQLALLLAQDSSNLPNNLIHLNRMLARVKDKTGAQALIQRVTEPYLDIPEAHIARAQAALANNDFESALPAAERALQLRPDWELAALARAQLQARQNPAAASAGLRQFLERNPESRDVRLALARTLLAQKQFTAARQEYQQLLQKHPADPDIIYPVAMLALQNGDAETGRSHLEKLLDTGFPDKSSIHFFLGQIDEEQQRFLSALSHYRAVTAGERFIPARVRTAHILFRQGQLGAARKLLQQTEGRGPAERSQLALAEAQILRDSGQHGEAYKTLAAALSKQPNAPDLLYDAALSAERAGQYDKLEQHLQHLLKLQPDDPHALNALGYSWADRNIRLPEAEAMIRRALEQTPDDPFITDSLGWVQFRLGQTAEAIKTLETAYRIKNDPEIAAHLGEALWAAGRQDEACRIWQEASERHPDNAQLAETRKKYLP